MLSKEQLKSKKPIKQWKKDLVVFGFMASLTISILNYYVSFLDSPTYLPEVYISFSDNIDKDNYINCTFSLDHDPVLAKIRIRGATNSNRPKKGYRLEFYTQKSLLGMREDDDWLLFANYMDNTRMRVKLSFDLWRSLQEMDHDEAILPDSEYVSLFINRNFQGLYLLAEKNDRKLFDLDRELDGVDSGLIFQVKSHTTFREYEEDCWEQDWPNPEDLKIMDEVLSDLIDFVNNAPDNDFFNDTIGIFSKFNKINV
ncbi:MAG: CotH kinase family protein, partial [Promethearchaeota archaeon]